MSNQLLCLIFWLMGIFRIYPLVIQCSYKKITILLMVNHRFYHLQAMAARSASRAAPHFAGRDDAGEVVIPSFM
jgi:hypothetical protein